MRKEWDREEGDGVKEEWDREDRGWSEGGMGQGGQGME